LRFVIFTDDHEPAHVRVIGVAGEAKIGLGTDGGPPRLIWAAGLNNADVRRAVDEAAREQDRLMEAWLRIHGGAGR